MTRSINLNSEEAYLTQSFRGIPAFRHKKQSVKVYCRLKQIIRFHYIGVHVVLYKFGKIDLNLRINLMKRLNILYIVSISCYCGTV